MAGLKDRSRARQTQAQQTPAASEERLVRLKGRHPTWGPKKLVARLRQQRAAGAFPDDRGVPAPSTAGVILQRHGLVRVRRTGRRPAGRLQPAAAAAGANAVWCAAFKGPFQTGADTWCSPLTLTDAASRFVLRCQALAQTGTAVVRPLFALSFREFGLPEAIRTDNGPAFASTGLAGLTPLAVWWLKLGIRLDRIDPGKPRQNGRHERMQRVLAEDAIAPAAASRRAQQRAFDRWRTVSNHERPHEALALATPARRSQPSPHPYPSRPVEIAYPDADAVRRVRPNGAIRWQGREVQVTQALVGEPVGLTWLGEGQWELAFGALALAVLDERTGRLPAVCARPRARADGGEAAEQAGAVLPLCPV